MKQVDTASNVVIIGSGSGAFANNISNRPLK